MTGLICAGVGELCSLAAGTQQAHRPAPHGRRRQGGAGRPKLKIALVGFGGEHRRGVGRYAQVGGTLLAP